MTVPDMNQLANNLLHEMTKSIINKRTQSKLTGTTHSTAMRHRSCNVVATSIHLIGLCVQVSRSSAQQEPKECQRQPSGMLLSAACQCIRHCPWL